MSEEADLYIYVLDNGRGLFTSKRKMKFNEAFSQMTYRGYGGGFNYMRRIPVVNGKTTFEDHLTPDRQDG